MYVRASAGEIMMWLGKVLIAVGCAWVAFAILDNASQFQEGGANELSSQWLIILVTLFFAYAVATGFMIVFDVCVDSVLICFVVDKTENGKPLHMDANKLNKLSAPGKDVTSPKDVQLSQIPVGIASPASGFSNPVQHNIGASGTPAMYENPAGTRGSMHA